MAFVLAASVFSGKLMIERTRVSALDKLPDHFHRSMRFHQMVRSHSSVHVFAHCRCVHQREPNSVEL
jgi:hypothetical protein